MKKTVKNNRKITEKRTGKKGFVGDVDSTGIVPTATAGFVMNNAMRATLKATPRVAGGERMIIENDMIDGVPVFVTEYAPANTIY